jgi:hypothetical protein
LTDFPRRDIPLSPGSANIGRVAGARILVGIKRQEEPGLLAGIFVSIPTSGDIAILSISDFSSPLAKTFRLRPDFCLPRKNKIAGKWRGLSFKLIPTQAGHWLSAGSASLKLEKEPVPGI